jgi:threonine efflux protein
MAYGDVLLAVGGTLCLGLLMPGPNLAVIAAHAGLSRRSGYAAASGAAVGAVVLALVGMLGLTSVLATMPALAAAVEMAGGGLLVWLGLRAVSRAAVLDLIPSASSSSMLHSSAPFRTALLTCLSNPVTLTVYSGVFSSLLPPGVPLWVRCAVVALIGTMSLTWYAMVAALTGRWMGAASSVRWNQTLGVALGAVLLLIGWRAVVRALT